MQRNIMQTVKNIQSATLEARKRLSDASIATRAECGKIQIVRVTYGTRGESKVTAVSEWLPLSDAAAFLNGMQ